MQMPVSTREINKKYAFRKETGKEKMKALLISLPSILFHLSLAFQNEPTTAAVLEHTADKSF